MLSQKKVAEIQKHLGPRDRTLGEGNENEQSVRCQCGWDGEESAMVSLSCFANMNAKSSRLSVLSVIYVSMRHATDLTARTIPEFLLSMRAISACLSPMRSSY